MAAVTTSATVAPLGAHIQVPAWAWAALAFALVASYVMLSENGLIMSNWMALHEFFHDGRHALGFPCH